MWGVRGQVGGGVGGGGRWRVREAKRRSKTHGNRTGSRQGTKGRHRKAIVRRVKTYIYFKGRKKVLKKRGQKEDGGHRETGGQRFFVSKRKRTFDK